LDPPAPAGTPRQSWSCSCSRVGFELLGVVFGDFPILSSFEGIAAHAVQLLIFVILPALAAGSVHWGGAGREAGDTSRPFW
jgi:hypothetical protein